MWPSKHELLSSIWEDTAFRTFYISYKWWDHGVLSLPSPAPPHLPRFPPFSYLLILRVLTHALACSLYTDWGDSVHGTSLFFSSPHPSSYFFCILPCCPFLPVTLLSFSLFILCLAQMKDIVVCKLVCFYFTQCYIFWCFHFPANISNLSFLTAKQYCNVHRLSWNIDFSGFAVCRWHFSELSACVTVRASPTYTCTRMHTFCWFCFSENLATNTKGFSYSFQ